jgi:sugar phosphate isomerase/epimerase
MTDTSELREAVMEQGLNRRRFLGTAIGSGVAAAGAGTFASPALGDDQRGSSGRVPRNRRGIQLYTMRRVMDNSQDDARRVLRWLGQNGYTEVEPYWRFEWTPQQFRRELDAAGLRVHASHDGLDIEPDSPTWRDSYRQNLEYAAALGQTYTGLAWYPPPYTEERFKQIAQRMNEAGALAHEFDLQFFYHNHDFEFSNRRPNGAPLYDVYVEETDRSLVMFELDILWIVVGTESAVDYMSADPSRFMGYHVKDHVWGTRRKADGTPDNPVEDVGPGMLDFPDVFRAGDVRGSDKHFFIEHDEPQLSHPGDEDAEFKTAKAGIDYLSDVRW